MKVKINSVNINYLDGVESNIQVHFEWSNTEKELRLNGHKTFTPAEYLGNESVVKLVELIKQVINTEIAV